MKEKKESNRSFYSRRVKRAIDELKQLNKTPSTAFTERVLVMGVPKIAPTIYVRESIEELTAYWELQLLKLYQEGQERNFSIPAELRPYRPKSQYDYIIENKSSQSRKDAKSIKKNLRTIKQRTNRHRMLTIGHAIISLVYLGFRCGFFYRAIGISISNGKLKVDSTKKMSTANILNECNQNGNVSKVQELLISSFIAGYESHISRNIQGTSHPPYEPKKKVIIELSYKLFEEQTKMKLTPEVLYNLLLTICPRGDTMMNSINHTPGKFVIINGVEKAISRLEDIVDYQEVYSKNPRLSSLYFSHADIPLLTAADKYWKDDPANFYIHKLESTSITEKDIEELNRSLKA
ncbi:TPA: hypothetical protein ACSTL0_000106 [Serratia fonticola]